MQRRRKAHGGTKGDDGIMTSRQYIIAIMIVASMIVILGIIFAGAWTQLNAPCADCKKLRRELDEARQVEIPKSYGEAGTEIYTIEIWEDGSAKIKTMNWYVNEIDEDVLIVTNKAVNYADGTIKLY